VVFWRTVSDGYTVPVRWTVRTVQCSLPMSHCYVIGDHIMILVSSHYKLKLTMSKGVLDCVTDKDIVVMSNKIKTTIRVHIYVTYCYFPQVFPPLPPSPMAFDPFRPLPGLPLASTRLPDLPLVFHCLPLLPTRFHVFHRLLHASALRLGAMARNSHSPLRPKRHVIVPLCLGTLFLVYHCLHCPILVIL